VFFQKNLSMRRKIITVIIILIGITACIQNETIEPQNDLMLATLYNSYAAEYEALAYQAYNIASYRILEVKNKYPDKTNLAVVLDIDETILDNSPYQAKLIQDNISYDSCWNEWCNSARARAIPGALSFLQLADSLGFTIFYLSNRKDSFVKKGTIENMKKHNFPQTDEDHFLLRTISSSKEARRQKIEVNYEIVLLCGDNLGDFYEDAENVKDRSKEVSEFKKEFGEKFIVLPNAMYGNWVNALKTECDEDNFKQQIGKMIGEESWCY